jgi:hypothetical protein
VKLSYFEIRSRRVDLSYKVGDESPPFEMMIAMHLIPLLSSSTALTKVTRKEPSTAIFVQS